MLKQLFGNRLRFLRHTKNITQEQLAGSIGVTKQHLGNIERGLSSPSFEVLERLCEVLEVPPASLFLFAGADAASEEPNARAPQPEITSAPVISGSGSWTIDIQSGQERWSTALHLLLGYSRPQEPSKELFCAHVHAQDQEAFGLLYDQALSGITPRPLTCRIVRNGGTFRHVRIQVDRHTDQEGAPTQMSMLFVDTTELRELSQAMLLNQEQLEQAIHEKTRSLTRVIEQNELEIQRRIHAERRARVFQDMVEASVDPMSFISPDYTYLAANWQAANVWGTTPEAMQGSKVADVVGETLFQTVVKPRLDATLKGEHNRAQGWFPHADGAQRFLDVTYTPRREKGHVVGVVASARDMTELKNQQNALAASEASYRSLFANAAEGLIVSDMQGHILDANPAALEMFGSTRDEFLGLHGTDFMEPEDLKTTPFALDRLHAGESVCKERVFVRKDGSHFVGELLATAFPEERFLVCLRDISERKRMEEHLRQSEELLRTVTTSIPGVLYQFRLQPDGAFDFPYMSQGVHEVIGISPEEATRDAQAVMGRVHEEDQHAVHQTVLASAESLNHYNLVHRLRRPDGAVKWVKAVSMPRKDGDGSIVWNGVALDITEQKGIEAKLEQQNMALENAERLAGLGSWEWNMDDNELHVSKNWRAIHGSSNPDPTMEELLPIAHPEDISAIEKALARAMESGEPYNIEHRIIRQDTGEVRWVRSYGQVRHAQADQPRTMYGAALDITREKLAEEALRESEALYRAMFEKSSEGLLLHDMQGNIMDANQAAQEMFGYPLEELKQLHASNLVQPKEREVVQQNFQNILRDEYAETEHRFLRRDGSEIIFVARGKLVVEGLILGVVRDVTQQKKAESDLMQNEARLNEAQRVACIGSFERDVATGKGLWSEQTYRIMGYEPFSVEPSHDLFGSHVHPDDADKVAARLAAMSPDNPFTDFTTRIIRTDGKEKWVSVRCNLQTEANSTPWRVFGTIQDVTEFRKNQENLEWELKVNAAIVNLKEVILSTDFNLKKVSDLVLQSVLELTHSKHGFVASVDPESRALVGHTLTNTLGSPCQVGDEEFVNVFYPAKDGRFDALFGHSVNTGEAFFTQNPATHPAAKGKMPLGHVPITSFMSAPGLIEDQVRGLIVVANGAIPYTEKQCEAVTRFARIYALALDRHETYDSLRKLTRAVENSPMSVVITDQRANIEYVNPAFCTITGYSREEVMGESPRMLKSGKHDEDFFRQQWETLTAGRTWRSEMCNRKKNGDLFWEQVAISPVKNESGVVTNYVAIKEDISERKELERLKEDVERIMRHDLKTPLNGILGLAQLLVRDDTLIQDQRKLVETIDDSGRRMLRMIDQSLDIFKMEEGSYEYTPREVNLTAVVNQVFKDCESAASKKDLAMSLTLNSLPLDSSFLVQAEEELLYTMLCNLITNAIEASPEGEHIGLKICDTPNVSIHITNQGAVPVEIREDFFQKYTTQGKKKGTGLGTYSAKLIADTMGYGVRLEVGDEENTTTVTIIACQSDDSARK